MDRLLRSRNIVMVQANLHCHFQHLLFRHSNNISNGVLFSTCRLLSRYCSWLALRCHSAEAVLERFQRMGELALASFLHLSHRRQQLAFGSWSNKAWNWDREAVMIVPSVHNDPMVIEACLNILVMRLARRRILLGDA